MSPFRTARERAGLTQADLAANVAAGTSRPVSQSNISRWEETPDEAPGWALVAAAEVLSVAVADLLEAPKSAAPARWPDSYSDLRTRLQRLKAGVDAVSAAPFGVELSIRGNSRSRPRLLGAISRAASPPRVVVVGDVDSGKSALLNHLIGRQLLPTGYRPTTGVPTVLIHASRRPAGDNSAVWLLRSGVPWGVVDDVFAVAPYRSDGGGVELVKHAEKGNFGAENLAAVIVFVDAPVLQLVTLIDVPGFQNDEADDAAARSLVAAADGILFLSKLAGFLSQSETMQLQSVVARPRRFATESPVTDVLIVATHAHAGITSQEVNRALASGAERAAAALQRQLLDAGVAPEYGASAIRSRMLPFWEENLAYTSALHVAICKFLCGDVGKPYGDGVQRMVTRVVAEVIEDEDTRTEILVRSAEDWDAHLDTIRALVGAESERARTSADRTQSMLAAVDQRRAASTAAMRQTLSKHLSEVSIEQRIRERFKERKGAGAGILPSIVGDVQADVDAELAVHLLAIGELVDELIGTYPQAHALAGIEDWDATQAFKGGAAGGETDGTEGAFPFPEIGAAGGGARWAFALIPLLPLAPIAVAIILGYVSVFGNVIGEAWQARMARKVRNYLIHNRYEEGLASRFEESWSRIGEQLRRQCEALEERWERAFRELEDWQYRDPPSGMRELAAESRALAHVLRVSEWIDHPAPAPSRVGKQRGL